MYAFPQPHFPFGWRMPHEKQKNAVCFLCIYWKTLPLGWNPNNLRYNLWWTSCKYLWETFSSTSIYTLYLYIYNIIYIYILNPPPTQRAHCSIKVQFGGTGKAQQFKVWCVCPLNGRHRPLKPLVFFGSWAPLQFFFFFFLCVLHYEAVMQHALQKVLSKRLGAGAEFVKKAELSGHTHVTHSHQTRRVQQDQIAKSLSPHAQKSP